MTVINHFVVAEDDLEEQVTWLDGTENDENDRGADFDCADRGCIPTPSA